MSVHSRHCCADHGCKYNSPDCPVELGTEDGVACEMCNYEDGEGAIIFVSKIEVVKARRRASLILHTSLPDPISGEKLLLNILVPHDRYKAYIEENFLDVPVTVK